MVLLFCFRYFHMSLVFCFRGAFFFQYLCLSNICSRVLKVFIKKVKCYTKNKEYIKYVYTFLLHIKMMEHHSYLSVNKSTHVILPRARS